ncbi:ABC transporter [Grosmannia clavigera kw1407]|uniref:ABC transporter n=2 Tax=Leptographium TaxID=96312 RepID=F0XAB3_GROCL|nr:ABC transporter [Grosmannia clavigera kw1407]EFX06115.1 ABC transporter [Grosmannia clavigera kw1407]
METDSKSVESGETAAMPGQQQISSNAQGLIHAYSMELVRSSSRATGGGGAPGRNPFTGTSNDPALDPHSKAFDARRWAQAVLHSTGEGPDHCPRPTAGVAYRNLRVHGYGSPTDYQKDVFNVLLQAPLEAAQYFMSSRRGREVPILRDGFDGLVRSGEMLLVLGRPGSGVTTLLKTVAGETNGLQVDAEAFISYQGIPMQAIQKRFRGEVVYQAETDVHFPQLTVGQTLLFAAKARTPQMRPDGVTRAQYAKHIRDVVMAVFGISHTVNTRVGSDLVRGVSGGERKRVSIAEVALSGSALQCWDNSTRGLDSASALSFANTLRLSTELAGTTALVAMYQASEAAYETFGKVCLLYEGRQIFFGPANEAKAFFVDMGYECPDRQTTADFLTSLTNPGERVVRPGFENRVPRTPDDFVAYWKASATRASLLQDIAEFDQEHPMDGTPIEAMATVRKAHQAPLTPNKSPFTLSFPQQVALCMTRGYERTMGDKTFFIVTVGGNLVISLVLGSVFYQLSPDASSITSRCILLFFAILFNALSSSLEILSLYAQRPIVEKHARYALYTPSAEAVSSAFCELPSKIFSAIAFNIPLYFMADLRHGAGHFFFFLLFAFTCTLTMSFILRTIGQASRTVQEALTPAAVFIISLVIYTGFVIPVKSMQGWMRWINYLNPIAYAYESLLVNELSGRNFPCASFVPAYPNLSSSEHTCSTAGAAPGADFVVGDTILNSSYEYYHAHKWRNLGILIGFLIAFFFAYLVASEYITAEQSKGEVLVFRRGHKESAVVERKTATSDDSDGEKGHQTEQKDICHWRNVCYDITIKGQGRRLLDHVDGWVKPGTLTCLMGVSGAGKTTLLDVLANRVTMGVVTGDMLVNGSPRDSSFQRKTGYVQQQDVHLETSTVREALRFSAQLRQPTTVSTQDKYIFVEEVIELLEMDEYADAIVGVPGTGLNVEQRKRLTIGVELAAKPDLLLFLDEPTSGLDSQTAWSVAALIRKLSARGQAVLCTIHQPSALLYQQFDRILLLAAGGRTVYFGDIGPNAETIISYFERNGAEPCGQDENPAEWMLSVIGAGPGGVAKQDWVSIWRNSDEYSAVQAELDNLAKRKDTMASSGATDAAAVTTYATPFFFQLYMCSKRVFEQYWRTPSYIYAKMILCFAVSLFIGLSFRKAPLSEQGLQNQMFSIFMLLVIFAFLAYQTMPHFIRQRELYEIRERASRTYSWYVFMLANIIVELPWNTIASLLVFLPFYYIVGMNHNAEATHSVSERGGLMFLLVWVFLVFESTFTDMVVAGSPTAELGATMALLLFAFTLIFCGVMVGKDQLPGFWIFMYRVSPLTYLVGGLLATGVGHHEVTCTARELLSFQPVGNQTCLEYMTPYMKLAGGKVINPNAVAPASCEFCTLANTDAFLASINVSYDQRWRDFGLMWAYVVFNVFGALFMYWLVRAPKGDLKARLFKLVGKTA